MYSIFANVASTYAPQFATMAQGIAFGRRLFEAFLTGFAIAIAVSFFVFPLTSRMVVLRTTTGYIKALSSALKAQSAYLQSLEDRNAFGQLPRWEDEAHRGRETEKSPSPHDPHGNSLQSTPEAKALKAAVGVITELHGKISGDLAFAKREIAYGKLDASELSEILKLMRQVMLPIIGMSSVADIFSRVAERQGWWIHEDDAPEHLGRSDEVKEMEMEQWSEIMRTLHQPFEVLTCWMNQGLQHVLFTLELEENSVKQRNKTAHTSNDNSPDLEASVNDMQPGDKRFAGVLSNKIDQFYEQRKITLDTWCRHKGLDLQRQTPQQSGSGSSKAIMDHQRHQRQLYLILYVSSPLERKCALILLSFRGQNLTSTTNCSSHFRSPPDFVLIMYAKSIRSQMEFLLWSSGRAVLDLVKFADAKVESGTMKKKRLITPGIKRVTKWVSAALSTEDSSADHSPDTSESTVVTIQIGDAYQKSKDPEHLPPTSTWQRFGNAIRAISHILGSQESAFGFRVACATLSIGIVAFLRDTQAFFIQQRLVWAMIMVSIGMTVTAGAGVFGFVGRVAGTGEHRPCNLSNNR